MRSRLVAFTVTLPVAWGCAFDTSGTGSPEDAGEAAPRPDGTPGGGPPDAGTPGGDARAAVDAEPLPACEQGESRLPFWPTNIEPCLPEPDEALELEVGDRMLIDTDEATIEDELFGGGRNLSGAIGVDQPGDAPEILVVPTTGVLIREDAVLRAEGSRALALVSFSSIDVEPGALITVGGVAGAPGAGMSEALCGSEGGRGADGEEQLFDGDPGGSGGGGGGYGAPGGCGAKVDQGEEEPPPCAEDAAWSPGGAANGDDEAALSPLRGGCSGGDGHGAGGRGGAGGGALQLAAAQRIRIDGFVSASGGGGEDGGEFSGGGGGGSGGALLLEAREVEVRGAATSNGGGGGEGMRRISLFGVCSAEAGGDGFRTREDAAPGGDSSGCETSGPGGDGGALAGSAGEDGGLGDSDFDGGSGGQSPSPAGGGGGGGGVGRIRISACEEIRAQDAVLSPAPARDEKLACEG